MSLFGDAPRFGKGLGGTLLGGEVFVDVVPQTQTTVGPGSYNTAPKSKKQAPKIVRSASVPKTPRRWNQPQLESQQSRVDAHAGTAVPSNRHSYLYSTMSHGVEVFKADVGLIPGPGAYTGKITNEWDEERRRNRMHMEALAALAAERGHTSPARFITSATRPDANLLAKAVVRHDVLFVHKTASTPGPGMYGRLYDRRSPWITRSFNVRVRSGNSPVRTRQPDVSPTSPAAIRANNNNNSNNHNNTHSTHSSSSKNNNNNNRCTTPQPRRGAFWSGNERAVRERDAVVLETARARSAGRRRPEPMWTPEQMGSTQRSAETQQTTRSSKTTPWQRRERRMSTREQELNTWWEQVARRTFSPRAATVHSPRNSQQHRNNSYGGDSFAA